MRRVLHVNRKMKHSSLSNCMCNGRELWKDLVHLMNGEQFNMEEAGGRGGGRCWGEVEGKGKGEDYG